MVAIEEHVKDFTKNGVFFSVVSDYINITYNALASLFKCQQFVTYVLNPTSRKVS